MHFALGVRSPRSPLRGFFRSQNRPMASRLRGTSHSPSDCAGSGANGLGAKIYVLVFRMFPFSAMSGYEGLVLCIMDVLGDLPREWITRWETIQKEARERPFDMHPEGLSPEGMSLRYWSPRRHFRHTSLLTPLSLGANGRQPNPHIYSGPGEIPDKIPKETLRILVPVIKGLLTYKRSDRLTASQALQMLEQLKIQEGI